MAAAQDALGIYVSVPFCRSKCTYCNFASGVYPASEHRRYVERLVEDIHDAGARAAALGVELPRSVDTVYLGGGTPSLLAPALLARLFGAIGDEFAVAPHAEITVECAPGQLADATLAALVAARVNRVSLGVQSFVDREAAVSGRLHTRAAVLNDLDRLRSAGIANLSIDLIAGLAGQTLESWSESLAALVGCNVPHASVYMLEVDEDSRLGRELLVHGARYHAQLVPSDDTVAQMYSTAVDRLAAAGLAQYEISNFARSGFESRHNLRYWRRRPYLGIGLDASSMLFEPSAPARGHRRALRFTTSSDLKAYLDDQPGAEIDWLSRERQHEEAWFLGLRLNAGVDAEAVEKEFGAELAASALEVAGRLSHAGLVSTHGKTVRLTAQGRLLSNEVFQEFIDMPEVNCLAASR
jgi:oxygen-independent coproporphyrinogen III oxidase